MSAAVAERFPLPPSPLPPDLIAAAARRRADGRTWAAIGTALRLDADALGRACAADPRFAGVLVAAEADGEYEGERLALRRLKRLAESENERVSLRASEVLVRFARERRDERAGQTASASGGRKPPEGGALSPREVSVGRASHAALSSPSGGLRPPLAEVKEKPAGALRAIPDLPPGKLDALLKDG